MACYAIWFNKCTYHFHEGDAQMLQLGFFVVVYIDDILEYSHCLVDHLVHLQLILDILRTEKFYGNMKKCSFRMDQIVPLGYVVASKGVFMDENKVKAIVD